MKYKLSTDAHGHPAETIVYNLKYHDYGLANDDTRYTGVEHKSMTLDPDGNYPSFTVPTHNLIPLE